VKGKGEKSIMKRIKTFTCTFVLSAMTIFSFATVVSADTNICDGVYVDEVNIGGKTKDEAEKLVKEYTKKLKDKVIKVKANDESEKIKMKDLGLKTTEDECIKKAVNIGSVGNLIQRYKDVLDANNGKKVYKIPFSYDEPKLKDFVENRCKVCDKKVQEPTFETNGRFFNSDDISDSVSVKKGSNGQVIDKKDTLEKVKKALEDWNKKDIEIEAKVDVKKPKHSEKALKACRTRIGKFTTELSGDSGSNRVQNVMRAATLANGKFVYPGETFSLLDQIMPFTSSNGYKEAGSYQEGKVVDALGGGVCQVSTTLYGAVLRAELEVVARRCHSMSVHYVPLAQDAMVAEGSSDFKFKNNTDTPIYIEGFAGSGTVAFNIYGKETRSSNRRIEFETEDVTTISPGEDVIKKDKTKPKGYREVEQEAEDGARAKLYKYVYVNGKQTDKILINSSYYKPSPNYITIGTGEGGLDGLAGLVDN